MQEKDSTKKVLPRFMNVKRIGNWVCQEIFISEEASGEKSFVLEGVVGYFGTLQWLKRVCAGRSLGDSRNCFSIWCNKTSIGSSALHDMRVQYVRVRMIQMKGTFEIKLIGYDWHFVPSENTSSAHISKQSFQTFIIIRVTCFGGLVKQESSGYPCNLRNDVLSFHCPILVTILHKSDITFYNFRWVKSPKSFDFLINIMNFHHLEITGV